MAEYDAFGRKIGEDTLSGLGGTSEPSKEAPRPQPAPPRGDATPSPDAVRPEPARPETVRPEPSAPPKFVQDRRQLAAQLGAALSQAAAARTAGGLGTPRRSAAGRGCLVGVVVLLVLIGAAVLGVVALVGTVSDVADKARTTPANPTTGRPAAAPKGLAPRSLVRPATFATALRRLQSSEAGRLTNLRLAPERIDVQLLTWAGRLRSVQLLPGGQWQRLGSDSGPGFDRAPTIPFARLNPAAPARLARRGAARLHERVARLQYLVPTFSTGKLTWAAYFPRSRYVIGDASGRVLYVFR